MPRKCSVSNGAQAATIPSGKYTMEECRAGAVESGELRFTEQQGLPSTVEIGALYPLSGGTESSLRREMTCEE